MGFQLDVHITAAAVFIQGLLSFFSPCVLPLLPLYMSYLAGGTAVRGEDGIMQYDRKRVFWHTLFFVIGIGFAFFLLGIGMTALGRALGSHQVWISRIGGLFVILLGALQMGIFGTPGVLAQERRLPVSLDLRHMTPLTAWLLGFVFSFAWTPCVGPALSSVLLMAGSAGAASGNALSGFLLIGLYTFGFVLPFLALGLFTTTLLSIIQKHRDIVRYTAKAGGALLMLMGVMMLTGRMNTVSGYLAGLGSGTGTAAAVTANAGDTDGSASTGSSGSAESNSESDTNAYSTSAENSAANADEQGGRGAEVQADSVDSTAPAVSDSAASATSGRTASAASESGASSTSGNTGREDTSPRYPAPDFDLLDQYGNHQKLSDYRGKVVFLNFWATWCPPCRMEMPDIQKLYEYYLKHPEEEVAILGIANPGIGQEQDEEGISMFLLENGYTYPTAFDPTGDLLSAYAITAFPTTFMIDRDGNMFGYVAGSLTEDIMRDIIDQTRAAQ